MPQQLQANINRKEILFITLNNIHMSLAETIQMSMFFGNEIHFDKNDNYRAGIGLGIVLIVKNKEHNIEQKRFIANSEISDERITFHIENICNDIYAISKNNAGIPSSKNG